MLNEGRWQATNNKTEIQLADATSRCCGFHLNSLYSPVGWMSWETCYRNYLAAEKDEQLLKAWTNTTLGLPWEEKGEVPDWGILFDRREHYKIGTVPNGGYILTAGVDVQNDRIELEVVAWGKNHESWSVDYRVIYGSPTTQDPWKKLSSILNEEFESEDGVYRKINMLAIDSGFATQEVYNWVRGQSIHNVMAVKGVDNSLVPLNAPTKVDVNFRGKKISNAVRLWKVGVSILKSELYGWLSQTKNEDGSTPHGYARFPEYDTEYFKQLTAEQLVTKIVKGYPKREWQKTRDRNEALDCRIYARAAAIALGIDRWSEAKWEQITGETHKAKNTQTPLKQRRIIRSRFI